MSMLGEGGDSAVNAFDVALHFGVVAVSKSRCYNHHLQPQAPAKSRPVPLHLHLVVTVVNEQRTSETRSS